LILQQFALTPNQCIDRMNARCQVDFGRISKRLAPKIQDFLSKLIGQFLLPDFDILVNKGDFPKINTLIRYLRNITI
jgi:hypothetical protein